MLRLPAMISLFTVGAALVGCGGNNYGQTYNSCDPPPYAQYAPSNAAYGIQPGGSFTVPPSQSNPYYAITSNGQGDYNFVFADPTGAATCFTGLITVQNPFPEQPIATNGTAAVLNNPTQISFGGVPGANPMYVQFNAGTDIVDIEAYVDGSVTYGDFYYYDDSTGTVEETPSNVAAFVSP